MPSEAGEAALAQGKEFIDQNEFVIGEELIEIGAEIFIEANDIERSGDAFLALTEMNLKRNLWQDAYRQIDFAIQSYQKAKTIEKLTAAIYQKAEIGSVALTDEPEQQADFAKKCFKSAHKNADKNSLEALAIDIYLLQAKTYREIDDLPNSFNYYQTATQLLEESDEKEKSPLVAEEITSLATAIFPDDEIELGLQLVDLATRIYMRLEKPIKTSEVYMKACNALLKINRVVEAVKLVLLASDTLMVAEEYANAADILEEIIDLLFEMKDYTHASICTGQIVTVHQKTGDTKQQTKAISKLVTKANKLISEGMSKEGEELWEQAANYSISVSLDFAKKTYTQRIDNLLQVGMYNSVNQAFQQFITILEDDDKELVVQGNKLASIASELLTKNEFDLTKEFVLSAVDFYSKANELESAKNLCLSMSESLINQGDDKNGIELIDTAARIANEDKGAHNAALVYVNSGFVLIESGYLESGTIAIDKAIEIELKANNISGCAELGNITMKKGAEIAQSDPNRAIDVYILAAKIFDKAGSKKKAGEASVIISTYYMNDGNANEAMIHSENAVDYFLEENNIDSAVAATKHALESARRFLTDNDFTNAVHILERGRVLVEKIGQFDLLSLIISLYLTASKQNLPNRKSAIGIFFLKRALDLVNSHPEPEEIKKVVELAIQLALEVIKKKNALAGAKVLEIVSSQQIAKEVMVEEVSFAFIDALKLTIDNE
jgi:tetratricopeptide (TPR) repeat protein